MTSDSAPDDPSMETNDNEPVSFEYIENGQVFEVVIEDHRWLEISDNFEFAARAALLALSQKPASSVIKSPHRLVVFMLSNDQAVHTLNKTYRGKDKATNILSFPATIDELRLPSEREDENDQLHIGDAILALETIRVEAETDNKTINDHISHLVIHGVLHLLGYDHETESDAEIMEQLEKQLLSQLKIDDPYSS